MTLTRRISDHPYEWGYVLGYTVADGCIVTGHRCRYLEFASTNPDFYHLRKSLAVITGTQGNVAKRRQRYKDKFIPVYKLTLYRSALCDTIETWTPARTFDWIVPTAMFEHRAMAQGFIRGYFDGDGAVVDRSSQHNEAPRLNFKSVNADGLGQVRDLLRNVFGVTALYYRHGGYSQIIIARKSEVARYWREVGISAQRKRDKFRRLVNAHLNGLRYPHRDAMWDPGILKREEVKEQMATLASAQAK